MIMHTTTGRWRLGLALSLNTALLWGVLPIALKVVLESMDAFTITWYRFLIAFLMLAVFVIHRNGLPRIGEMKKPIFYLLMAAIAGLCSNYILYLLGLDFLSPSSATVVIQLAPMFMLLGSLIIFKERFSTFQWIGFAALVIGLILFFNDRLGELFHNLNRNSIGVLLIAASAAVWAIYALAQKQLLKSFPSETIMLYIYFAGTILFLPFARPARIVEMDIIHILLLLFCAFNTLAAYGSFAEALDHWEASSIGMVLAATPLITVAAMELCTVLFPAYIKPEQLNLLSIIGASLVVTGSILNAMVRTNNIKSLKPQQGNG